MYTLKDFCDRRGSSLDAVCQQLGLSQERVAKWMINYSQGKYDIAFELGGSLSGSGGRPKATRASKTAHSKKTRKRARQDSTSKEPVNERDDGQGGIAAGIRRRAQAGVW